MGTIEKDTKGFGKRKRGGTVMDRKRIKRQMVCAIVKKLKAEGKPVDLQAINKEVLNECGRKHQSHKPKNK